MSDTQNQISTKPPLGITIVSVLMIIFGFAEMVTGFSHNFLGIISVMPNTEATYLSAAIGAIYFLGGLLLLVMGNKGAKFALFCLIAVIIGRILMVLTGFYPITPMLQLVSIIAGTVIAIIFAVYIWLQLDECSSNCC